MNANVVSCYVDRWKLVTDIRLWRQTDRIPRYGSLMNKSGRDQYGQMISIN